MFQRRCWLPLLQWAIALAVLGQTSAYAQPASLPAEPAAIELRLANGSIVRIPCDKTPSACASAPVPQRAWITESARRAPLKRSAKLFDISKPGVVAGTRG